MHATQPQGGSCSQPGSRRFDGKPETDVDRRFFDLCASDDAAETYGQNELDHDRLPTPDGFAAWCAKQAADPHGYVVTDAGHAVLAQLELGTNGCCLSCGTSGGYPYCERAVNGLWSCAELAGMDESDVNGSEFRGTDEPSPIPLPRCEQCGEWMPGAYTWDEPLCSDCVTVVPADNEYGFIVTALDTAPSTCPVDLVTETDDEAAARVLRSAATYLERHGWIQGAYYDATAGSFTPPACLVGAIGMVCYGGPVDAPAQHFDDPGFLDFEAAVLHLDRYLLAEDGSESYEFNDSRGRRLEDVTHVLRDAAIRPAHELIDALRVIDRHNADTAALSTMLIPGGTFAEDEPCERRLCPECTAPDGCVYGDSSESDGDVG